MALIFFFVASHVWHEECSTHKNTVNSSDNVKHGQAYSQNHLTFHNFPGITPFINASWLVPYRFGRKKKDPADSITINFAQRNNRANILSQTHLPLFGGLANTHLAPPPALIFRRFLRYSTSRSEQTSMQPKRMLLGPQRVSGESFP